MEHRNTGRIIRMKHDGKTGGYTPISNKILQSKTLTPVQKSILVHLLSLKPDWVIRKTHLHKEMNIGRDCFRKGFDDLIDLGYITFEKRTIKNMVCYDYTVWEDPESSVLESSNTDIQSDKNSVTIESKERENNNLESNTVLTSSIESIYTGATILGQNEEEVFKQRNLRLQKKHELEKYLIEATPLWKRILSYIFNNELEDLKKKIGEEKYLEIQPHIENYLAVYNEPKIDLSDGNNEIHLPKITGT